MPFADSTRLIGIAYPRHALDNHPVARGSFDAVIRRLVPIAAVATVTLGLAAPAVADTLTVTTTADSGTGSLRQRVAAANAGDVVFLPANASHYMVTSAQIEIPTSITIRGAGATASVIDGADATRVFHVQGSAPANGTVRLEMLTVTGGSATSSPGGGAILVDSGSLTVLDAALTGNSATVADGLDENGGGAVYNRGRDTSIQESTVSDNSVTVPGSAACCHGGGGIFHDGSGEIGVNASRIRRNTVSVTGPGADGNACCSGGGGIYQIGNTAVTITGSNLDGNTVTINGADGFHGGGGLYVDPTGDIDADVSGSTLSGNKVKVTGPAGDGDHCCSGGGAIYTLGGIDVIGSILSANTATVTAGDFGHGGGAVNIKPSVGPGPDANFTGATIRGNTATVTGSGCCNGGGGVMFNAAADPITFDRSLVASNRALISGSTRSGGGGIYEDASANNGYVNSTISGNSTNAAGAEQGGGGIYLLNAGPVSTLLANVTLAGNSAPSGAGGGVLSAGNTLRTKNSILAGNTAPTGGNCAGFPVMPGPTPAVFTSLGNNLESTPATCGLNAGSDRAVAAVKLGPLKNNGGPTQTRALLAGSPAIDGGNAAGCTDLAGNPLNRDQRMRPRPLDGTGDLIAVCDIGAFEAPAKRAKCTLKPKSSKVPRGTKPKLRFKVKCDEAAKVTLKGKIKIKRTGKPDRSVTLKAAKGSVKASVARTLKLAVKKSVRKALANGAKVSGRFTLAATNANGPAGAKARIKKLKLAKP
jgi:hypothetical protein